MRRSRCSLAKAGLGSGPGDWDPSDSPTLPTYMYLPWMGTHMTAHGEAASKDSQPARLLPGVSPTAPGGKLLGDQEDVRVCFERSSALVPCMASGRNPFEGLLAVPFPSTRRCAPMYVSGTRMGACLSLSPGSEYRTVCTHAAPCVRSKVGAHGCVPGVIDEDVAALGAVGGSRGQAARTARDGKGRVVRGGHRMVPLLPVSDYCAIVSGRS